jgi:dihydrofolate reductase
VLLGRRTYDDWAAFWPGSDIEPFASFINPVQKFVVTATPPDDPWSNASVVAGDPAAFVADLKQQPGGDIGVHGSISLARSLMDAGLVDQLRLVVAPAVQVNGRKLFDGGTPARFVLNDCATSPAGYLLLDYQVQR